MSRYAGQWWRVAATALTLLWSTAASAEEFKWHLPPGFPRPSVPRDNPMSAAKVALGRRLFFDTRLSISGTHSCATCHRPELAYTDGRAKAVGARGDQLRRAAPSLSNIAYQPAYTWADPTVASLETQMRRPLFNQHPPELGLHAGDTSVLARLSVDPGYLELFAQAFAGASPPVSIGNLIKAIACFERTLISGRSPFDRYLFDDDRDALTPAAKRGMTLFFSSRVGCAQCHFGLNFSGPLRYQGGPPARAIYANTGFYGKDLGLIEITRRSADLGRFRVPTLRNIALTAPYMHDGRVATLDEVLDHYAGAAAREVRIRPQPLRDARIPKFTLSPTDKQDLLEFLHSLSDPGFLRPP